MERVFAYKRDHWTTDTICLDFYAGDRGIGVSENDEGYSELVEQLPGYIEGFPPQNDWFAKVAFPAFETNFTVLLDRSEGREDS